MDKDVIQMLMRLTKAMETIAEKSSALGSTPKGAPNDEPTIADGLSRLATQMKYLGNGDAGTTMGAIENLAVQVKEGSSAIASAIESLAEAVDRLAESRE